MPSELSISDWHAHKLNASLTYYDLALKAAVIKRGSESVKKAIFVGICLIVAGCATTKTMQAVGGSRSDGVVKLAYEFGMFEKPRVDMAAALEVAKARCAVWGYKEAEPFGGGMRQCTASGQYGCERTMVTVEYQCTGANTPS